MEKELKELNELVKVINEKTKAFENMSLIYNIKPKFSLGQKVWVLKDCPSWYDMPVEFELETAFKEETIYKLVFSRRADSNTYGCQSGTKEKMNEVVVCYNFSTYSDSNKELEENIWGSLKEAMEFNRDAFNKEKKRYIDEIEKKRQEKKKQLQEELKKL